MKRHIKLSFGANHYILTFRFKTPIQIKVKFFLFRLITIKIRTCMLLITCTKRINLTLPLEHYKT